MRPAKPTVGSQPVLLAGCRSAGRSPGGVVAPAVETRELGEAASFTAKTQTRKIRCLPTFYESRATLGFASTECKHVGFPSLSSSSLKHTHAHTHHTQKQTIYTSASKNRVVDPRRFSEWSATLHQEESERGRARGNSSGRLVVAVYGAQKPQRKFPILFTTKR